MQKILQTSRNHLNAVGARGVTLSRFRTEDRQRLAPRYNNYLPGRPGVRDLCFLNDKSIQIFLEV